ncbi:hypothetical protein QJS04_geneDACA020447 [Acorus gramineus]|uniref:Uncharacterized protein n=1 Tax=Acorus gramineus TaxID=55184 RepID=A0AAV9BU96_ACOGR|nr:hypothetical protein QJS04_geneDACA020447 [Acorus gramineus]
MSSLGAAFLAFNSIVAVYRSRDDIPTVCFIVAANATLSLLFRSIRAHESAPEGSNEKERHKIWIWCLAALLNVGFCWKVTAMLPMEMSSILWALVAMTTIGTFYLYFLLPHRRP